MTAQSTFVRSDPSMLTIQLLEDELNYRADAELGKDEKKLLEEKIHCTACNKHLKKWSSRGDLSFHPSFEVIICEDCKEFYASGEFSVDADGSDIYCRWCGQGGSLYCCSRCSVAICEKCVKINFPKTYLSEIEDDAWKCFICDSKPIWPHRAIAAAVREYLANHKPSVKNKRKRCNSDDSNSSSPVKMKKVRNSSSNNEDTTSDEKVEKTELSRKSKIIIDSSEEENVSERRSKRSKGKKGISSKQKSFKKYVITISDEEDEDDSSTTSKSRKDKSGKVRKSKKNVALAEEESDEKPRRSSRKSQSNYKETDDEKVDDSPRKSEQLDSKKVIGTSRRSKKIVTDDDELDSDKSVFRDKDCKMSSTKSSVKSKSTPTKRRRLSNDNINEQTTDALRVFQFKLKDSLKDLDKFLKIIVDSSKSFHDKYVNEEKYLQNLEDLHIANKKYRTFLGNLVNSTKRIESTFFSSVEPLLCDIELKKEGAKKRSISPSPTRKPIDTSKVSNGLVNQSSVEKSDSEGEVEEKSFSKMKIDDENDTDLNTYPGSDDVESSTPVSCRKSTLSTIKYTDKENDSSPSSEEREEIKENGRRKTSLDASLTNGSDEISNRQEGDYDCETTVVDTGVSDSLIVNLGTEDESIVSEEDSKTVLSKKKSDDADSLEQPVDEKCTSDELERKKKSLVSEDERNSLDIDGGDSNTSAVDDDKRSKTREEFANDLLQNSESSENETNKNTSSDEVEKKLCPEKDRVSPDKTSDIGESKEQRAKSTLLNESDEDSDKNNEIESKDRDVHDNSQENFSKSNEKNAKNALLESTEDSSSANDHHSNSFSDSGMSGVDVLKNSDSKKSRQKRRTKRLSNRLEAHQGKDSDDEDKEINRLTNLETLKKKKVCATVLDSEEEEIHSDSEKENQESKRNVYKREKKSVPKKSLEDYISDGSDDRDMDIDEDPFEKLNSLLDAKKFKNSTMTQNDFCKQQLLDSSDSNDGNESDIEDELILPSKLKKENRSRIKESRSEDEMDQSSESDHSSSSQNDKKNRKRAKWRNDYLLKGKISISDSSDDEKIASRIRKREAADEKRNNDSCNSSDSENLFRTKPVSSAGKKRKFLKSCSDESSSSSVQIIEKKETKKRKQQQRKRIKDLWTDSDDDSHEDADQSTQGSASKGRKNIRKVLKDEELAEETRVTAKQEEARKRRIAERQSLFNEVFQVVDVESEAPSQLVLDFDPETKTELVSVHPNLVKKLKPHQAKGIKFMWDSCFESLKQIEKNRGSGCILAHCMGLGKTLQVIALVHTVLRYPATSIKKVLIICPVSTILNWVKEFKMWLNDLDGDDEYDIDVFHFSKSQKNAKERAYLLKRWAEDGGVMILGYDMFRTLVNSKTLPQKWRETVHEALLDPGADLVVCDEGHTLKNEKSAISVAAMKIRTRRRIVLTGTPLQNNLIEYHCMVQFIKPNLLGDKKEFQNRFANPITNGQFTNSTSHDVRLMKRRSHVLHKMLDGIVQRFDYNVLTPFLPPKHEFVISVALSDLQAKIYEHYIKTYSRVSNNGENRTLFKDYQIMRLIWTHPFAMNKNFEKRMKLEAEKDEEEDSMDDFIVSGSDNDSPSESEKSSGGSVISVHSGQEKPKKIETRSTKAADPMEDAEPELEIDPKAGAWWRPFITDEDIDDYKQGPKLVLLFAVLRECELIGDKVLIFSQSLPSLDMIEHFLKKTDEFSQYGSLLDAEGDADYIGTWRKNVDYFRLDGSTPSDVRTEYTNRFNHPSNQRARLFLISTKAGGLGINLTAANRVIIFDASWNPSHDVQSIFRVYRFGQTKPCYIYRFLSQGTMEEKIYERQVTKLSISCRVVDEQQIDRHFSRNEVEELYRFVRKSPSEDEIPKLPKDRLMAEILKKFKSIILSYHEHDSLLENIVDEELTEEERKQAWEEYENDKKPKPIYPSFPSYLDAPIISDEAIRKSLQMQNPNATPDQIEEMLKKVRIKLVGYYAEQQRQNLLVTNKPNVPIANKKELDEQLEMRRRALAYQTLVTQNKQYLAQDQNPGCSEVAGAGFKTPTKMGISPSKYGSYSSPVKGMPPPRSPARTPLKRVNDLSPLRAVGEAAALTDVASVFDPSSEFKPLETPSTWSFRWTTPRSLDYLEGLLKANCRFSARYERVGENVLMHLPFCVRTDTLKRKLVDHLAHVSFSRVSVHGLDQRDVLDIIIDSVRPTSATQNQ